MPGREGELAEGVGASGESPGPGWSWIGKSCRVLEVREATEERGWREDLGGETSGPQGTLRGDPAPGSIREPAAPGSPHPFSPAPAGPQPPLAPPTAPPSLTSHDVQGQGHQEAEPGAAGPPGNRCRAPRHPGAHPSRGGRGLGGRLRWPPRARHLPRPLRAAPTRPAGSPPPPARPPARGRSSQTMEREPEQEGGRERARHMGSPSAPPGPSALRIASPERPRA